MLNMLEDERNTADVAEIETRNSILTNIHLYNQRYSGIQKRDKVG